MDDSKIRTQQADLLMKAIMTLKSEDEAYDFFEDICTIAEIRSMAQRLEVAVLLRRKTTYQEIARITGASTASPSLSRITAAPVTSSARTGFVNVIATPVELATAEGEAASALTMFWFTSSHTGGTVISSE